MKKEINNKYKITENDVEKAKKKMMAVSKKKAIIVLSSLGALVVGGCTAAGIFCFRALNANKAVDLNAIVYGLDKVKNFKIEIDYSNNGEKNKMIYSKKENKELIRKYDSTGKEVDNYVVLLKNDKYYDGGINKSDKFEYLSENYSDWSLYYSNIHSLAFQNVFSHSFDGYKFKDGKYYNEAISYSELFKSTITLDNNKLKNVQIETSEVDAPEVVTSSASLNYSYDCVKDDPYGTLTPINFDIIDSENPVQVGSVYTFNPTFYHGETLISNPTNNKIHASIDYGNFNIVKNDSDEIIIERLDDDYGGIGFECCGCTTSYYFQAV